VIKSRWGRDFPPVQTGPGAHPASCTMDTGSFPWVNCGRGVGLITPPHLVPKVLEKIIAIPLLTLRSCVTYKKGGKLPYSQRSRYNDSLRADRSVDRIPVGMKFSSPVQPTHPPLKGYLISFPRVKRPGYSVDHTPPSSSKLHLYYPLGLLVLLSGELHFTSNIIRISHLPHGRRYDLPVPSPNFFAKYY